ncbi:MAG: class I tRNA ligase family protein, partial [bacterium]|nr:class I tRNA ligase family protein [bacterium]
HHAWGRTYKDLWQRYHTLKGDAERYQNGFDCQGLWVEVEVEKELGFKSKKDIETYGVANFVNKCKERVHKYSAIQTEQSKRLGYFMDWEHSYFTMSDENNYAIWNFLKTCWERGWLYKGHESIPWCPRCETAISQHEILTEDYQEIVHDSIYLELPLVDSEKEYLLVWTTTPWTLIANIAVAVDPKLDYALVVGDSGDKYWLANDRVSQIFKTPPQILQTVKGKTLVGRKYRGAFDELDEVKKVADHPLFHTVVAADPRIMPVSIEEGTGLIHTAVSAGEEDFKLGKKLGLPMIPVIADNADYLPGLGQFSGQNAKKHPEIILDYLKQKDTAGENWVFAIEKYTHRYPRCWRCKTELVWKVADEWYIAMDIADPTDTKKLTLRKQMMAVAKKITWLPGFGLDRELDWLKNMHDWLISKKNRYWGLALPIYECAGCGHFEVVGSKAELEQKAVAGWSEFAGNTPHRPWIDAVMIACPKCGEKVSRIADVGNPWLDAGIVPHSTLPTDWFPADFITESFPGQFKNWFYSLIAQSTVLKKTRPFKTVLGFATMLDSLGKPFHKSAGNAIEFVEGADKFGADVIRWICVRNDPANNLLFGAKEADEIRRHFHLTLWNIYNFFVTYAGLDKFDTTSKVKRLSELDNWILARLNQTVKTTTDSLNKFASAPAVVAIESFVADLSLWYVRRSRDRVGPTADDSEDKQACHWTLYTCLTILCRLLAPFTPFIADEIFTNLTGEESVHLSTWPKVKKLTDTELKLIEEMKLVRKIVEMGLSSRKTAAIKVRQPLSALKVKSDANLDESLLQLIKDELNVKEINWQSGSELQIELNTDINDQLKAEGEMRELARQVQEMRKEQGARLDQTIKLTLPKLLSNEILARLKKQTLAIEIVEGDKLWIELM